MKRVSRGLRTGLSAVITLAAGCAHHGDPDTSAYVFGTIFIIVGLALGVALILNMGS